MDADGYYDSIDAMVHKGSGTMTGRALRYVHDNMFKDSRTGVARIIVVITDGNAQDDVVEISEVMKKENIFISVVGVGKVDRNHIGDIASKPTVDFVTYIDMYSSLKARTNHIASQIRQCRVSARARVFRDGELRRKFHD